MASQGKRSKSIKQQLEESKREAEMFEVAYGALTWEYSILKESIKNASCPVCKDKISEYLKEKEKGRVGPKEKHLYLL
ncbi:hypothetical protein A4A49_09336 [Nicotiana attenuata]|uniref:Uncharacterized protein n=1 Tax=Nicotiana attenuata TaxID=49451 RepID=A0A314L8G4_NICAT|nr:hypothetical protein A4A49_09336 [Nicotiana attenuata]